jgi:hypothetical protein
MNVNETATPTPRHPKALQQRKATSGSMVVNPDAAHFLARRAFLKACGLAAGAIALGPTPLGAAETEVGNLPVGSAPAALPIDHFPSRLHAFVWRNWPLVPADRMARIVGATKAQILRLGRSMGLQGPPPITRDQQKRSYITVIRRNWHLLPYGQLLDLLGWTAEKMAFTLREDDFLYVKLGNLKPRCERLRFVEPDPAAAARASEIAGTVRRLFPGGVGTTQDPLFGFIPRLSRTPDRAPAHPQAPSRFSPRFCYSYFALYGDPLLEPDADPYPDGYLSRLAASGVDGVWLQGMLTLLFPFPWDPARSLHHAKRLERLRQLVARARKHGIGVHLYLNEPRAQPLAFFKDHPGLKGAVEGDHAALCISVPEVREHLKAAIAHISREVPDLAGFFTITGSENFTHCWSHGSGGSCPRCGKEPPANIVASVLKAFHEGIQSGGGRQQLIAWDWGWQDPWVDSIIDQLPAGVALQSVSEWSLPIRRGGVASEVGEYSISAIGPGPRATRHWARAKARGLKTIAKVQCGNTWELSAVPYIPAVANVAQHAANLRRAGVQGLMLGWTLGGHPSPNLEVVAELGRSPDLTPDQALANVAQKRFGADLAPEVVRAWKAFSAAFSEYPFGGGLYSAPLQMGPANPLYGSPTRFGATMVGIPYDDLKGWCGQYPPEVFAAQLLKVSDGFDAALAELRQANDKSHGLRRERTLMAEELRIAEAASIHFRSAAEQCRFIQARDALTRSKPGEDTSALRLELARTLRVEIDLARRLHALQSADSRLGFEATNHYYFVPVDLAEKTLNCEHLLKAWNLNA